MGNRKLDLVIRAYSRGAKITSSRCCWNKFAMSVAWYTSDPRHDSFVPKQNGCNGGPFLYSVKTKGKLQNGGSDDERPKLLPSFHDADGFKKMKYRRIGCTDMIVSTVSIGGSGFGNVYGDMNEATATETLHKSLKNGLNYIDTAPWYGQGKSETYLGKALKGIPREAYIISTKVCRYEPEVQKMFDFSSTRILQSAEESLSRLNLPYVDLLQIHDVEFAPSVDMIVNESLPALQKLKDAGKCRYIGITGYPIGVLKEVVKKSHVKIDTVLSYCHLSLNDSTLLSELDFFHQHNLPVINASPIGMGLLCNAGPPEWHPARDEIKTACRKAVEYCNSKGVDITKLAIHHSISCEEVSHTFVFIVS